MAAALPLLYDPGMDTIWASDLRVFPALPLLALGIVLFARGLYVMTCGWWMPIERRGKNLTVIRGMRTMQPSRPSQADGRCCRAR